MSTFESRLFRFGVRGLAAATFLLAACSDPGKKATPETVVKEQTPATEAPTTLPESNDQAKTCLNREELLELGGSTNVLAANPRIGNAIITVAINQTDVDVIKGTLNKVDPNGDLGVSVIQDQRVHPTAGTGIHAEVKAIDGSFASVDIEEGVLGYRISETYCQAAGTI